MITMPGNNQIMKYFEYFCKLKCFRVQEKNVYNNERVQPLKETEGNRKKSFLHQPKAKCYKTFLWPYFIDCYNKPEPF